MRLFPFPCSPLAILTLRCVSAKKVDRWQTIPNYRLNERGPLYDRLDTVDRDPVVLDDLDLLDDDGDEIPVFTNDGRQVPRRIPLSKPSRRPCPILVDFTNARDLFEDPRDSDFVQELDASPPPHVTVNAFRQAFLHSVGHLQVNTVPFPMVPLIANINAAVAIDAAPGRDEDDLDSDDEDHVPLPLSAVTGVDCQMYNSVMHRVRGTAKTHDAQRGDVTAAFAGSYGEGATQKRKATRLRDACNNRLPHDNFSLLIEHDDLDTSLRMECVHRIDLTMLRPERRGGKYVHFNINDTIDILMQCLTLCQRFQLHLSLYYCTSHRHLDRTTDVCISQRPPCRHAPKCESTVPFTSPSGQCRLCPF